MTTMKVFGSKNDLTLRKPKDEQMDTQYGILKYFNWCQREVLRIGRSVEYKENKNKCWVHKIEKEE